MWIQVEGSPPVSEAAVDTLPCSSAVRWTPLRTVIGRKVKGPGPPFKRRPQRALCSSHEPAGESTIRS